MTDDRPVQVGPCSCGGYGILYDADEMGRCHEPMTTDQTPTVEEALAEALRPFAAFACGSDDGAGIPEYGCGCNNCVAALVLDRYAREGAEAREREWPASNMLEAAWGLIANAWGGDWPEGEWKAAAERWRDAWLRSIDAAPEPVEREPVITLALCEQDTLILRPGILYRFEPLEGCERCAESLAAGRLFVPEPPEGS